MTNSLVKYEVITALKMQIVVLYHLQKHKAYPLRRPESAYFRFIPA